MCILMLLHLLTHVDYDDDCYKKQFMQYHNNVKGDFGITRWNVVINNYTHTKHDCPTFGGKIYEQCIFQLCVESSS
jgi:hypothetical protein